MLLKYRMFQLRMLKFRMLKLGEDDQFKSFWNNLFILEQRITLFFTNVTKQTDLMEMWRRWEVYMRVIIAWLWMLLNIVVEFFFETREWIMTRKKAQHSSHQKTITVYVCDSVWTQKQVEDDRNGVEMWWQKWKIIQDNDPGRREVLLYTVPVQQNTIKVGIV